MSEASWNLQTAIFALLSGESPAIAGGKIYDSVPDAAASAEAPDSEFPFVQIGEMDLQPDDTDVEDDGVVETVTLHVWSRYRGQKEVKEIMQQIKDLLHNQQIAVTGRSSALAVVTLMRNFLDPDGRTRHGVVSVQVTHRS